MEGAIGFTDIARLIKHAMDKAVVTDDPTIDEILEAEKFAIRAVDEELRSDGDKQ